MESGGGAWLDIRLADEQEIRNLFVFESKSDDNLKCPPDPNAVVASCGMLPQRELASLWNAFSAFSAYLTRLACLNPVFEGEHQQDSMKQASALRSDGRCPSRFFFREIYNG